jgi:hypothetical protein
MITLVYNLQEMTSALEKIGYTIKLEKEMETVSYYHNQTDEVERNVYNCYYRGERINLFDRQFGAKRVEAVFEQELRKRVLSLF